MKPVEASKLEWLRDPYFRGGFVCDFEIPSQYYPLPLLNLSPLSCCNEQTFFKETHLRILDFKLLNSIYIQVTKQNGNLQ